MTNTEMSVAVTLFAGFRDESDRDAAAAALHRSSICGFETFSPMPTSPTPTHASGSLTPRLTLAAGLLSLMGGFAMQVYANVIGYPLDIGGRPKFSWPSFVPIAFEIGMSLAVLVAIVAAFVSMALLKFHNRVDDVESMRRAMSDRWLLALHTADREHLRRAQQICSASGAVEIEEAASWPRGS